MSSFPIGTITVLLKKYLLVFFLAILFLFWGIPLLWGKNNVPPRVSFGDKFLKGDIADIHDAVSKEADVFEKKTVTIIFQNKKINTNFLDIGLKIDRDKTVENLKMVLSGEDALSQKSQKEASSGYTLKWWSSLIWGYKVPAHYSFDLSKLEKLTGSKFNVVLTPVQEATVRIDNDKTVLIPAKEGFGIDGMAVVAQVLRDLKNWDNESVSIKVAKAEPAITTNEAEAFKQEIDRLTEYPFALRAGSYNFNLPRSTVLSWVKIQRKENLETVSVESGEGLNLVVNTVLAGRNFSEAKAGYHLEWDVDKDKIRGLVDQQVQGAVYRAPVNGVLAFEGGAIQEISASQSEITTEVDSATEKIAQALKKKEYFIELPVNENPASLSLQNVKKLGIDTLIGKGESDFTGSPKNRRHNLAVGSGKFNGVVIPQGEEFSFLTTLGPVDKSTGYLPELVIKGDKTIPEYGGGMCQVSTTCFRAEVNSGLRTTERQNHAYPVQYYSPQGTDATVYIPHPDLKFMNDTPAPILIQTKIVGNILTFEFFGKSDGRTVTLEGPRVWDKKSDGSMKTEWIQKVFDKSGKLMFQKNFLSKYDSPSKYPHPGDEKPPTEKKKKKKGGT